MRPYPFIPDPYGREERETKIIGWIIRGLVTLAFFALICLWAYGMHELEKRHDEAIVAEALKTTTTTTTAPTTTTPTVYELPPEYPLTDEERDLVERVVMAEAGGESYEGQRAVAQCILNACRLDDLRPAEVIEEYSYTGNRPDPTESVKKAVTAVFDDGVTVFGPDVLYFYAPELCRSDWHETQDYVTTIGCHRFFKEAKE